MREASVVWPGAWRGHIGIKPGRIYPLSPPDQPSDLPTTKDDIPNLLYHGSRGFYIGPISSLGCGAAPGGTGRARLFREAARGRRLRCNHRAWYHHVAGSGFRDIFGVFVAHGPKVTPHRGTTQGCERRLAYCGKGAWVKSNRPAMTRAYPPRMLNVVQILTFSTRCRGVSTEPPLSSIEDRA
jgi:hypothetical protein